MSYAKPPLLFDLTGLSAQLYPNPPAFAPSQHLLQLSRKSQHSATATGLDRSYPAITALFQSMQSSTCCWTYANLCVSNYLFLF